MDTSAAKPEDVQIVANQDIFKAMSKVISNLQKSIDCYFDARNLPLLIKILSANHLKIRALKTEGARLRCQIGL